MTALIEHLTVLLEYIEPFNHSETFSKILYRSQARSKGSLVNKQQESFLHQNIICRYKHEYSIKVLFYEIGPGPNMPPKET